MIETQYDKIENLYRIKVTVPIEAHERKISELFMSYQKLQSRSAKVLSSDYRMTKSRVDLIVSVCDVQFDS